MESTGIVTAEVKKVLEARQRLPDTPSGRNQRFWPSEMCKSGWCIRATYYRMSGLGDQRSKPSFNLESVFAEGDAVHAKWQGWLADSGKMWGDWRCSRCGEYVKDSLKPEGGMFGPCVGIDWVKLNSYVPPAYEGFPHDWKYKEVTLRSTSLPISGHADGALAEHNLLIELKSMGVGSLRYEAPKLIQNHTHNVGKKNILDISGLWEDFSRPLTSHLRQGNLYLWMCAEMGLPFNRVSFVYEFKANQSSREFTVGYSPEIVQPLIEDAHKVMGALKAGTPPECVYGGCSLCRIYEKGGKTE